MSEQPKPTEYTSETEKYIHLTTQYCYVNGGPGCGIDLASQGSPVVPWAWQLDLPPDKFAFYNSNHAPRGPIQLRGDATNLGRIDDASLDFVYSSHLLEDFEESQWESIFRAWSRVIKPGGYLIILIPDKTLWAAALARGQSPNCAHRREGEVGLMSKYAQLCGLKVIRDELTACFEGDYSILGVFQKT